MARWTEQGERLVNEVANRYGVSYDAVSLMLDSVLRGNGTMAQFNIYELGGGGQWMRGGMTMVGDMFNYQLKSKVDGICGDLSHAIVDQNVQVVPPPPPMKSGGTPAGQNQSGWNQWWPAELGSPNTSGAQNQYRYAYFAGKQRLAISDGNSVTVYNTLDHNIGGVSQQQGGTAGVSFTSQYGTIDLRTLPLVSGPALDAPTTYASPSASSSVPDSSHAASSPYSPPPSTDTQTQEVRSSNNGGYSTGSSDDIIATIERLAKLRDAGALTEDEFASKKSELLSRL